MGALSKGFQILEAIRESHGGLAFSEVVASTSLPKATVHRLLNELVDLNALIFDEVSRDYRLGLLLAELGATVTADYDLRQVARPHLEALQRKTGSVVTLGIRDDDSGIYLDKIEPKNYAIRLHSEVGKSFPLHCTAMGKVLLAHASKDVINRIANRNLRSFTERTITDSRLLRDELSLTLERGYAIDDEEITRGLVCIAAPILGLGGAVAGALSCTVQTHALENTDINELAAAVKNAATRASGTGLA